MTTNGVSKFCHSLFSCIGYCKVYIIHLKKSRFVEGLLFYPKNEVTAFFKIEL